MAKVSCFVIVCAVLLLIQCQSTDSQQISYANADLGSILIRPHSTTQKPEPHVVYPLKTTTPQPSITSTTKASGFFNNLRNIFSRGGSSTTPSSTVTTATTTTHKPSTRPPNNLNPSGHHHQHNNNGHQATLRNGANSQNVRLSPPSGYQQPPVSFIPTTTAATTTTTVKPVTKSHKEDFPALPSRNNNHQTPSAPANGGSSAWSATTPRTPSHSQNAPRPPLPTSQSTSSLISIDSRNEYNNNNKGSTPRPELASDDEIQEITEALFKKSAPNLLPYIMVNLQGRTRSSLDTDDAPHPLLIVNETILNDIPTIVKMRKLFNNYEPDMLINEYVSPIEREEENDFINEVLQTPVMKSAMQFLQEKGVVTADPKTHFDLLKTIWFNLYSRGQGKIGSSAFEHVFMNEIKNSSIIGLHNWIWYYHNEGSDMGKMNSIDYKGYMKSVLLGNKGQIVKYRFSFNNIAKPVDTMFIGTPPELDMALYTICFEVNKSECRVSLDGYKFVIRTYPFKYRGKRLIGSAFPEI